MAPAASLIPLSAVEDSERRDFYHEMFPGRHRLLAEHWRWWYRSGEVEGIEPIAAVEGARMVGQAGVIPVRLEAGGTLETAIWFIDFAVRPECQGKGLGKLLTEAWMALSPNQITFCNERSMHIFRKYGWHELFTSHRCGAAIQPLRVLASRGSRLPVPPALRDSALIARASAAWLRLKLRDAPVLTPEPLDPRRLADLMRDAPSPGRRLAIHRDEEWIDWRFARNPFLGQHLLFRHGDAFAVARKFRSNGLARLNILLVEGPHAASLALYRGMTRQALDEGLDLVWMHTNDAELLAPLRRFLPSQMPVRFASFSKDTGLHESLKFGIEGLQGVDSDNDLLNPSDDGVR